MSSYEKYDVIVIGKGPAGISAALYTARANLSTLVVGSGAGALEKTSAIENYYGFEAPVSGRSLLEAGLKQAARLGVSLADDEVTAVEPGDGFTVKTVKGSYGAKAVLIATGQAPKRPGLPGIREFEGKGVSYCTTCDGFFFRKKSVGILGGGNYAVQEALELRPFTDDITIFTNGSEEALSGTYAQEAAGFRFVREPVKGVTGDTALREILLESGPHKLDGLFVASGTASSVDFAAKLGVSLKENSVTVDTAQATNVPGVFAAGDCTGGFRQVSVAVGQGAIAGRSMIEYLRKRH